MKFLILLLFIAVIFANNNFICGNKNDKKYWSIFLLEQQWPPTILINDNIINYNYTNNYFTVKSIIPSDYDTVVPTYCNVSRFNMNHVDELKSELKKYWTNFYDYYSMLKYVYYKYYSCLHDNKIFYDEYIYFDMGLQLRKIHNLYNILKANNIIPSNNIIYNRSHIEYSIFYKTGVMPIIMCDKMGKLEKIIICFNRNINPIFCPEEYYNLKCSHKYVHYPIYFYNNT